MRILLSLGAVLAIMFFFILECKIEGLTTQCTMYSDKITSLEKELSITRAQCDSLQQQINFMVE